MFLRVLAVLLGLIGFAGIALTGFVLHQQPAAPPAPSAPALAEAAPPPRPPAKTAILVAARMQHAGNLMSMDDIGTVEVPAGSEPDGHYADTREMRVLLRGSMIRHSLAAGEPILAGDVLNPGDRGFLAAVLSAGMRAVTVGVDSVSGTAGLIWPGDRVDLMLTQANEDRDQPVERRVSGETVLTNLRVIAVDQQIVQGGQGSQANPTNVANTNRTVTLEASPYDAERIAVASRLGRISLAVRAAADDGPQGGMSAEGRATPGLSKAGIYNAQYRNESVQVVRRQAGSPADASPAAASAAAAGHDHPGSAIAAGRDTPPVAWAGDVSAAIRDRFIGKSSGGVSIRLYHGPGAADEVRF